MLHHLAVQYLVCILSLFDQELFPYIIYNPIATIMVLFLLLSFQIGSGWNLAGLVLQLNRLTQLTKSDFWYQYDVILSRWRSWRPPAARFFICSSVRWLSASSPSTSLARCTRYSSWSIVHSYTSTKYFFHTLFYFCAIYDDIVLQWMYQHSVYDILFWLEWCGLFQECRPVNLSTARCEKTYIFSLIVSTN